MAGVTGIEPMSTVSKTVVLTTRRHPRAGEWAAAGYTTR